MEGGGDPVLATSAGRHFLINRDQNIDQFWEVDSCGHGSQQPWSTRAYGETAWSDPQDVAVDSTGRPWVARFFAPSILIKGETDTETDTTIDLSHLDPDGNPDMSSIRIVDGRAFVALERLSPASSGFVSTQKSEIAVIDTTSLGLVQTITLAGRNPIGLMSESSGKLWLADAGDPELQNANEPDAGIEVVDTQSLTSTLLIPETTLGASAIEVAVSATCGAAILADATTVNHTSLVDRSDARLRLARPRVAPRRTSLGGRPAIEDRRISGACPHAGRDLCAHGRAGFDRPGLAGARLRAVMQTRRIRRKLNVGEWRR
jgi:hypothetical protein